MNTDFFDNDDGFDRVIILNGYLQADNGLIPKDLEWDWFQEIDDDLWQHLDYSPVGPNALLGQPVQDAWDWEQGGDDPTPIAAGYQQADAPRPRQYYGEDAELFDENLEPVAIPVSFQQGDNAPPARQFFEDYQDWDEHPREFFADDFGNDDAPSPQSEDVWDFSHDDAAFDACSIPNGYQQLDAGPPVLPIPFDDAWDWSDQDASAEDPWQQIIDDDDDAVGPNNIQAPAIADGWNWDDQDDATDDSWQLIIDDDDDAIQAGVISAVQYTEDAADFWTQESDDDTFASLDLDPVGAGLGVAASMPVEDPFEPAQDADDEEWTARDADPVGPDAATAVPFDDAWDWSLEDDEQFIDDAIVGPNLVTIPCNNDGWDWHSEDGYDEHATVIELIIESIGADLNFFPARIIVYPDANRIVYVGGPRINY